MSGALATRQHSLTGAFRTAERSTPNQTPGTFLSAIIAILALLSGIGAVELARTVIWPMLVTGVTILSSPTRFPSL